MCPLVLWMYYKSCVWPPTCTGAAVQLPQRSKVTVASGSAAAAAQQRWEGLARNGAR